MCIRDRLKLSQMTSLAKMADDEEEPETPEKTKLVPAGIVLMVIGLLAAAVATVFSLNEKYNVKEIMFLVVGIAGVACLLYTSFIKDTLQFYPDIHSGGC